LESSKKILERSGVKEERPQEEQEREREREQERERERDKVAEEERDGRDERRDERRDEEREEREEREDERDERRDERRDDGADELLEEVVEEERRRENMHGICRLSDDSLKLAWRSSGSDQREATPVIGGGKANGGTQRQSLLGYSSIPSSQSSSTSLGSPSNSFTSALGGQPSRESNSSNFRVSET